MKTTNIRTITAVVFEDYETLDLFGPIEMFGRLKTLYRIQFASLRGGIINNQHGVALHTVKVDELPWHTDILLIVGGQGTRQLVHVPAFLTTLQQLSLQTEWVLSVCTGSALLAKAGLLDGKRATSNKRAWAWVISQSDQVKWIPEARWVIDGKFYTSSGVSAGMDMALGFIADQHGSATALQLAKDIEYHWQEDSQTDDFFDNSIHDA